MLFATYLPMFPVPATTLGILKGRFHMHAPGILAHAARRANWRVAPCLLELRVPARRQRRVERMRLLEQPLTVPRAAWFPQTSVCALLVSIHISPFAPTQFVVLYRHAFLLILVHLASRAFPF